MRNALNTVREAPRGARLAAASAVATTVVFGLLSGGVAGATTVDDPTGGGAATLGSDITGWITTYGVPLLVTVMAVGLVIGLFVAYGKKSVKAAK